MYAILDIIILKSCDFTTLKLGSSSILQIKKFKKIKHLSSDNEALNIYCNLVIFLGHLENI